MTSCNDVDRVMTPFVDGDLAANEAGEVERHLVACPECRERSAAERVARDLVRSRAAELDPQAPMGLKVRCAAWMPVRPADPATNTDSAWSRRVIGWVLLSVEATVLLALGGVFVVGQHERLEAAFIAQLALDHDRCFGAHGDTTDDFGRREAEATLVDGGWNVAVPDESIDFNLVDARRCLHDGGDMVHLLCEWPGQPVSLFLVPGRRGSEASLEIMGRDAVTWGRDDWSYVLVAKGGPVDLGHVAAYVQQYTD